MTHREVAKMTAAENNVAYLDVLPSKRGRSSERISLIRMQIARRLRGRGLSLTDIGTVMGGFNHTSVLSMLRGGKGGKKR